MQSGPDYKKFVILYVDDEELSLKYFARAYAEKFRILTASNAQEGLKILEAHADEIGLLMTDQRMPGEKGVWLLERARQLRPSIIRILATAYADMDAAIAAVNTGAIYKYITKPWDPPQLENTLARGLEFFMVQKERDELLQERAATLQNIMMADRIVSLGLLAAGMSHHIRNSLVAVKTFLDLAPEQLRRENVNLDNLRNPDFWKDYHHNVQGQILKINHLLNDLWSASKSPPGQFADQVKLCEVIDTSIKTLQPALSEKQIEARNEVSDSLPMLTVDEASFRRLFELLLKDEAVSLPPGCKVTFSASSVTIGSPPRTEIEIIVRDNGPGLSQEGLRYLFDPFAQRNDDPAEYGINLMACYFIVHHHGGRIEAQNEPGQGTTFRIRLTTNPEMTPLVEQNQDFYSKLLSNEAAWRRLAATQ